MITSSQNLRKSFNKQSFSYINLGQPTREIIAYAVHLCSSVLKIDNHCRQVVVSPYEVSLAELKKTPLGQSLDEADCLPIVLSRVYLSLQRNKLIHSLMLPSCIITACQYDVKDIIEYGKCLLSVCSRLCWS